jgi:hypothetical protein
VTLKEAFLLGHVHGLRDLRRRTVNPHPLRTKERIQWHRVFTAGKELGRQQIKYAKKLAEEMERDAKAK